MIVDPDFLDHWRTGMVADALGDPFAPMYILRLWAHCQERKSDTFVMPTRGLKAQCKFPGDADAFEAALIEAGFLERNGDTLHVAGWADKNASLLAAWENGNKGGRPRKEPKENPRVTQEEPTANPDLTQTKPIREEKSREDTTANAVVSAVKPAPITRGSRLASDWALPRNWGQWAIDKYPHWSPDDVRTIAQGFRNHWVAKAGKDAAKLDWEATWQNWCMGAITQRAHPPPRATTSKQSALEARNAAAARQVLESMNHEPI